MGRTEDISFDDRELAKGENHKSYVAFHGGMRSAGMPESDIRANWQLLLEGFKAQPVINEDAQAQVELLQRALIAGEQTLTSEIRRLVVGKINDTRLTLNAQIETVFFTQLSLLVGEEKITLVKNLLRSMNPYYIQFVRAMVSYLNIEPMRHLALWSGGLLLSDYAFKYGYSPLERTKIGAVLNELPIHCEWAREAPIWNLLSQQFVAQASITEAHVFFRTIDQSSVLLRQEVPLLRVLSPRCRFFWHPIMNYPASIGQLGLDGTATKDSFHGFDSLTKALQVYVGRVGNMMRQNQRGLYAMNIMGLTINTRSMAPFANEDSIDWDIVKTYEQSIMR